MKNTRIHFIGTALNKSARESDCGECHRIVNLKQHNNALKPTTSHHTFATLNASNRTLRYIHSCNNAQHFISTSGNTLYHEMDIASDGNITPLNRTLLACTSPITTITSLGNTLIIGTASDTQYLLYRNDAYIALGCHPQLPIIRFNEKVVETAAEYKARYEIAGKIEWLNENLYNIITDYYMGSVYKLRNELYEKKCYFQPIMIRYALRLFDGSHIMPSPPILLNLNYDFLTGNQVLTFAYDEPTDTTYIVENAISLNGYGIEYTIDTLQLDEWSDIVCGIDIFVSQEVAIMEEGDIEGGSYEQGYADNYYFTFNIPSTNLSQLKQTALEETLFYKVASIDINNAVTGTPTLIANDFAPTEVIYRPRLVVDTSALSRVGANRSYVYNNRLHLADITQELYTGYPLRLFSTSHNSENGSAWVYTRTRLSVDGRSSNEVIACSRIDYFDYLLSPLISYPDNHAIDMEIVVRYNDYEYRKTIALHSVANEDRASYLNEEMKKMDIREWECIEITPDNLDDYYTESQSQSISMRNRLIVSETNNPFFFPTELSYNISNGIITGIAATTAALSQGQYGEFPLYIFTTEGIWAMQVGSNEVCYARATPISQEPIEPAALIIPIENGIVYRSGDNLLLLKGATSKILLPLKEVIFNTFNRQLPSIVGDEESSILDASSLNAFFSGNLSAGYRHINNELIFGNLSRPYSIALELSTGHLYRIDTAYQALVWGENALYAQVNNNQLHNLNHDIKQSRDVCLISKPIALAPDTYTRLRQVMWRMQGNNCTLKLIVTASHEPEGESIVIQQVIYEGNIAGHLPMKIHSSPYKYYRLILVGNVPSRFLLECVDMAFDVVENNKLR